MKTNTSQCLRNCQRQLTRFKTLLDEDVYHTKSMILSDVKIHQIMSPDTVRCTDTACVSRHCQIKACIHNVYGTVKWRHLQTMSITWSNEEMHIH